MAKAATKSRIISSGGIPALRSRRAPTKCGRGGEDPPIMFAETRSPAFHAVDLRRRFSRPWPSSAGRCRPARALGLLAAGGPGRGPPSTGACRCRPAWAGGSSVARRPGRPPRGIHPRDQGIGITATACWCSASPIGAWPRRPTSATSPAASPPHCALHHQRPHRRQRDGLPTPPAPPPLRALRRAQLRLRAGPEGHRDGDHSSWSSGNAPAPSASMPTAWPASTRHTCRRRSPEGGHPQHRALARRAGPSGRPATAARAPAPPALKGCRRFHRPGFPGTIRVFVSACRRAPHFASSRSSPSA